MKFTTSIRNILLTLFCCFVTLSAQVETEQDEIQVFSQTVQTTLRVSNSNNKPQSVEKSDLKLMVDGIPQNIDYFATNQINKFIVLLDASDSMKGRRFRRCLWFLNELAESSKPGQSFDVIIFSEQTEFIGTFTKKDKKSVFDKLKNLTPDGETALYESVVDTLQKLDRQPETSALIVLTDGGDNKSSEVIKNKAENLLNQYGTLTYLVVLHTKMAFRDTTIGPNDTVASDAVKDFQRIIQPVSYIIKNEIEFNELASRIPREAGFLVKVGFDPSENLPSSSQTHKLEIVHSDRRLKLTYRQSFLMQ